MSILHIKALMETDLPVGPKFTAVAFASHANQDGGSIYPAIARVAMLTSRSPRQIERDVAKLLKAGVLVLESSRRGGRSKSAEYRLDSQAIDRHRRGGPAYRSSSGKRGKWPEGITDPGVAVSSQNDDADVIIRPPNSCVDPGPLPGKPVAEVEELGRPWRQPPTSETGNLDVGDSRSVGNNPEQPKDKTSPSASLRPTRPERRPAGDGNYSVIKRIALDLLEEGVGSGSAGEFAIETEADLVEAVKCRCAALQIEYGDREGVPLHIVHRACAAARCAKVVGRLPRTRVRP